MSPALPDGDARATGIGIHLDALLADRDMTLTELADRVDLTLANLSILKTGKVRSLRLSTLAAICRELGCQPGDLLSYAAPWDRPVSAPPPPHGS